MNNNRNTAQTGADETFERIIGYGAKITRLEAELGDLVEQGAELRANEWDYNATEYRLAMEHVQAMIHVKESTVATLRRSLGTAMDTHRTYLRILYRIDAA